jgi:predicted NAD/FAD-dependent oxidoreductase
MQGFECDEALSVAALTRRLPARLRHELIDPLCVAALNTPAAQASARVFLRVLKDALFSGPGSADLLLPSRHLDDLLPGPAQTWLEQHGTRLRLGCRTMQLRPEGSRWMLDDEPFDGVVLATTALEAARLVEPVAPAWAAQARALRYEPIVTVYLRGEPAALPFPMLALRSDDAAPAQFVFDHGSLRGEPGLLAFVISGAGPWLERGNGAILEAVQAQAASQLALGKLQPWRVLTEKRATFACFPGLRRPVSEIAPGLFAAGDYIAGPYPATLEGAVRSGLEAAAAIG